MSSKHRDDITRAADRVFKDTLAGLKEKRAVVVVKAPPGSGKTYLLSRVVHALRRDHRIAIAAQTNAQADDLARRLADEPWKIHCQRFVRTGGEWADAPKRVTVVSKTDDLPSGPCVVIATAAKWGFVDIDHPFDVLLVDEAWQMQWSQFVPLGRVAPRFVLIGDPGQIPPVVAVDSSRWETAQFAPHLPAPEIVLEHGKKLTDIEAKLLQLPASRRLPHDAVELIQSFYDFTFGAWALPGERAVVARKAGREPIDQAIDLLGDGSVAAVTCPTGNEPPPETDEAVADLAVAIATRLLERKAHVELRDAKETHKIAGTDIGISATHRVMNELVERRLQRSRALAGVRVDTPERWQGLERLVTIAVHPLSSVLQPSSFDLDTGRLCVMASRHRGGLIVVGRDHIDDTLENLIVSADQPLGRPDVSGRGHQQHLAFWHGLRDRGRIVHR